MTPPAREPVLVYDGDCAFCTQCVRWLEEHLPHPPIAAAWQLTDLGALGLTAAQCEQAVQWVQADGRTWSGAQAVGRLLLASGGPWAVLGRLLLLPPGSWIAAGVYRLVASNRHRLPGGTPACALPAAQRPGFQQVA